MPNTRTLIKTGDGNSTAALVAGTVTNVAVVTLPSDPGYEYDVSVSVMLKATGTIVKATTLFGNFSILTDVGVCVAGDIVPIGARSGNLSATAGNGGTDLFVSTITAAATASTAQGGTYNSNPDKIMVAKYGPGAAVTCSINSAAADTYYLHYSYIGRKTVTESF